MESDLDGFSGDGRKIIQYDAWNSFAYSENNVNIQQQQLVMYLLVKLCKERGLSVNCFQRIITRLLDNKLISISLIPQHILQRINSYTSPIEDILSDLLRSPFLNDLVSHSYALSCYRIN